MTTKRHKVGKGRRKVAGRILPPRLSSEQYQSLHWLGSPTASSSGSEEAYASVRQFVRRDSEGRWRSTAAGREALEAYPVWGALDYAAETGKAYLPTKIVSRLERQGLVEQIGGSPYPTLERTVRLTDAGRALVQREGKS
jgi:hypothetical protein